MKKAIVIGAGFSGLSAACFLAKEGMDVTVLEKHTTVGGRARAFSVEGFTFDMGPSWYWMPDVFDRFFSQFGKKVSDFYALKRLDPSYQVLWNDETTDIPADLLRLQALFESYEKGSGAKLQRFLKEGRQKYDIAMKQLVFSPGLSISEFLRQDVIKSFFKMDLLQSFRSHARSYFSNPKLLQLIEFPILFLGALPQNTPALYSLMNYADMELGTWYPDGGMVQIAKSMQRLAESLGVKFIFKEEVKNIEVGDGTARGVSTLDSFYKADVIIAGCDYHYAESLLPYSLRNYSEKYWNSRIMAPSCLLYYVGVNKRVNGLQHHNLFFDAPFEQHAEALYTSPAWPADPLMYVCCPSKTDTSVAPTGCENLFILIPVAPGLADNEAIREQYFDIAVSRIEKRTGVKFREEIVYKRSYAASNFIEDYQAYKGNAYGLANTLSQTAIMKPSIRNKKLSNLFYTGQLTVPGPGLPPAIISGEIVATQALKSFQLLPA